MQGKYTRFEIDPTTFAIYNYTFTGAPNEGDMTGGHPTPVYASKIPDHRGLTLTSAIGLELRREDMTISRTGTNGLSMKIQTKDCAQGGIFQMEPNRGDGTRTRIAHQLAAPPSSTSTTPTSVPTSASSSAPTAATCGPGRRRTSAYASLRGST